MGKWLTDRTGTAVLFFLLLGYAVYEAFSFGLAARLLPLIIGIPAFCLSVLVLGAELHAQRRNTGQDSKVDGDSGGADDQSLQDERSLARKEWTVIAWLAGLVLFIYLIGILWAIPIFLILFMRLQGREPWKATLSVSFGTIAFIYLLFIVILRMQLYQGVLFVP